MNCPECGYYMTRFDIACPRCALRRAQALGPLVNCPKCGHVLNGLDVQCPQCIREANTVAWVQTQTGLDEETARAALVALNWDAQAVVRAQQAATQARAVQARPDQPGHPLVTAGQPPGVPSRPLPTGPPPIVWVIVAITIICGFPCLCLSNRGTPSAPTVNSPAPSPPAVPAVASGSHQPKAPPPVMAGPVPETQMLTQEEVDRRAQERRQVAQQAAQQQGQQQGGTVYVTRTGKKYHRAGCQYLRSSAIPMTLQQAQDNGYTACSKCF
jgi:hypothetical protein